jgi:LuxR family maltose regulon positive regulatory protein
MRCGPHQEQGMLKGVPTTDNPIDIPRGSDLLETKLYARPARANLVSRPRITRLLDDGLCASLILVSAPAGFGKTTLLAEWLSSKDQRGRQKEEVEETKGLLHPFKSTWLSLDVADNDPARFWTYVILSLQAIHDELGETALAQLRSPQPPPAQLILPTLLNEIESLHARAVLVLDDYHVITSTAVHSTLTFFLENLPPTLRLVISTRSDPPIPMAKLRSRGQVVEVRADKLRFTPDEAAAFLTQTMGLALSSEQVAALAERAEGWIAGLQMAALSMQGRDAERVDAFIRAFAGTNRFIMDYLLEEVLAREPEEIQTFLLRTAILNRLSGPLCDAVIGNHPEGTGVLDGQGMLEMLERRNLFVVPLDDDRRWYRYHHLFADLLQTQLQKSLGVQNVARLHLRAAEWYEQNGSILDAIHHASIASDDELVERLIKQNYLEMMNRGEMSWVRFWMGNLSKELIYRRPWLCLYEAMNRSWFGQLEEADLLLNEAETRIRAEGSAPGAQAMLGYHAYVKSRVTAMQGDTRRAIEFCLSARGNAPVDSLGLQIDFSITLGYEYFLCGDFINADKILNETIRLGYRARAINNPVAAYCLLARSQVYQGRLHEADARLQKAAQLIHEAEGQHLGAVGLVEVEAAALLCEWNDVEQAFVRLKKGLDYLPWWGKADDFCLAYITLARIQRARGNRTDAVGAVEKAAQLFQTCGVFSEAHSAVEAAQVKLWLLQGDWPAVDRWADTVDKHLGSHESFRFEDELTQITQTRVFVAQNKLDEAVSLLSSLEKNARAGGRQGRLVEILLLKALAMQILGESAQASAILEKSLGLAKPEGFIRVFLDEGKPMQVLLTQWLAHTGAGPLRSYGLHLLSQFKAEIQATAAQGKDCRTGDLVEPLTHRELEVLQLICAGDSNQTIADKLVITVSAVKKHTGNILGKLGVTSRAQAMVKARELGLYPGDK